MANQPSFKYSGMTLLFYDPSHGNQLEFFDPDGKCYLWYPGNPVVVVGNWRIEEKDILFRYGSNTYNPVTDTEGGDWEPTPLAAWTAKIIDAQPGDVCGLATGRVPYALPPHPGLRSVLEAQLTGKLRRETKIANSPLLGKKQSGCTGLVMLFLVLIGLLISVLAG